MCLSLSRPELVESLIVEDISPRISSSIGLIPNFIEAMKRAKLSAEDLPLSQVRHLASPLHRPHSQLHRGDENSDVCRGSPLVAGRILCVCIERNLGLPMVKTLSHH